MCHKKTHSTDNQIQTLTAQQTASALLHLNIVVVVVVFVVHSQARDKVRAVRARGSGGVCLRGGWMSLLLTACVRFRVYRDCKA